MKQYSKYIVGALLVVMLFVMYLVHEEGELPPTIKGYLTEYYTVVSHEAMPKTREDWLPIEETYSKYLTVEECTRLIQTRRILENAAMAGLFDVLLEVKKIAVTKEKSEDLVYNYEVSVIAKYGDGVKKAFSFTGNVEMETVEKDSLIARHQPDLEDGGISLVLRR